MGPPSLFTRRAHFFLQGFPEFVILCSELLEVSVISDPHSIDVSSHDRYLIYEMLDREVSFEHSKTRKMHSGVVEHVLRDIFDNQVHLTLNGRLFQFDEPVAIVRTSDGVTPFGTVVFVYGDLGADLSDEELFDQMRGSSEFYGETVDDVLSRTRPKVPHVVQFYLGKQIPRRRTWRMKKAAS